MNITRAAAIIRLVDMLVEVYSQEHDFIREVLHAGRAGFDSMDVEQLQSEVDLYWPWEELKVVP